MEKVVGYFSENPTWRLVAKREYRKYFSHDTAAQYLKKEILESIDREVAPITKLHTAGFYAGLRFLFAETTYLSHLYWGFGTKTLATSVGKRRRKKKIDEDESKKVTMFMRRFGILAPTPGLHYEVFRHGLQHTHHPKWIKKGREVIPWYVSNVAVMSGLGICVPAFKLDLEKAIAKFITEIESEKKSGRRTRLNKFFEGLTEAGKVLTKKDLRKYARNDFSKLRVA